jgi:6-phosphogluconate dehydrogenase
MMQSLAEGFAFMRQAPLNLDIEEVARVYARGSIIESKLIEYLRQAFKHFGKDLEQVSGAVAESGEGRWAVETAKKVGVPTPALEAALAFREASRKNPTYAGKLLTALRNQFGGHAADPEHKKA